MLKVIVHDKNVEFLVQFLYTGKSGALPREKKIQIILRSVPLPIYKIARTPNSNEFSFWEFPINFNIKEDNFN